MRYQALFSAALVILLCAGCGSQPADTPEEPPSQPETEIPETEDHILLTLDAPLSDGRTLRLEAVGKVVDEYTCGVREVRVYDGEELLQTVLAQEGIEQFWGQEWKGGYTSCWSPEDTMEVLDLDFDGNTDFGLFGWVPNNTIPFFYWRWDPDAGRYEYVFTLQGVDAHPDTKELTAKYKRGPAGAQTVTEYYKPDEAGELYLDRVEVDDWSLGADNDRPGFEIYQPPEGVRLPVGDSDSWRADLTLIRREVPDLDIHEDGSVVRYTEIWELRDGTLQRTGREEYMDE